MNLFSMNELYLRLSSYQALHEYPVGLRPSSVIRTVVEILSLRSTAVLPFNKSARVVKSIFHRTRRATFTCPIRGPHSRHRRQRNFRHLCNNIDCFNIGGSGLTIIRIALKSCQPDHMLSSELYHGKFQATTPLPLLEIRRSCVKIMP